MMYHFFEALTNTSGESLIGYFARVVDRSTQSAVPIYSDESGTPISVISGVADMAKTDDFGNIDLYVEPGTYNLDIFDSDSTTFRFRVPNVAMNATQGDKGDKGDKGDPGAADNVAADLSQLKAAPTTNVTMLYDGATFNWTLGNYTGQADDINIVKADSTALSTGAWVRGDDVVTIRNGGAPQIDGTYTYANLMTAIAFAKVIGGKSVDLLGSVVVLPAGLQTWTYSDITILNGTIRGPAVASQAQPSAYIKMWGSLGSAVPFGITIGEGTRTFAVSNSFATGDLLYLSNYPTDATDAYTEGPPDVFGRRTRSYANVSTSNLRQTRRKELLLVRSASGSTFTTETGSANAYTSTTSLQFQKVTPIQGVVFSGVRFENVFVNMFLCRDVLLSDCIGKAAAVACQTCFNTKIDFLDFDCADTDGRIDFYDASRVFSISGSYRNFNSTADNGPVKINGCCDWRVDVLVDGIRGNLGNGIMIDTNFDEAPNGYSDLPAKNGEINGVIRDCNGLGLYISCDPYAAKAENIRFSLTTEDCGYSLKGTENVSGILNVAYQDGSSNSGSLYGTVDCMLMGQTTGGVFESTVVNPRNGAQTRSNTRLTWLLNGRLRMRDSTSQLSRYDKGAWSPQLMFGMATTDIVQTAQTFGSYTRIGDQVTVQFGIVLSSKGSSTGTARIGGLPYQAFAGAYRDASGIVSQSGAMSGLTGPILASADQGATTIALFQQAASGTNQLTDGNFTNTSFVIGSVTYNV